MRVTRSRDLQIQSPLGSFDFPSGKLVSFRVTDAKRKSVFSRVKQVCQADYIELVHGWHSETLFHPASPSVAPAAAILLRLRLMQFVLLNWRILKELAASDDRQMCLLGL